MDANTILARHDRILRTIFWKAADSKKNLYDVCNEYGVTKSQMDAFLKDFNDHGVFVPRPDGWQRPSTTNPVKSNKESEVVKSTPKTKNEDSVSKRIEKVEKKLEEILRTLKRHNIE